jgi:hypothetical protein
MLRAALADFGKIEALKNSLSIDFAAPHAPGMLAICEKSGS